MGFRDKNRSYLKQPGTQRVLVLGDSYAAGANVGDDETFSSHLESTLNEHANFEVINISVAAWSTDQQLLYLYEQINKWKPDYIILTIAPNDIRESFSKQIVKIENEKYPDFQGKVSSHVFNLARLNNIEFIDIFISFKKSNNPQKFFLNDDYHLNPQGHKRVADLLKEYFEVNDY